MCRRFLADSEDFSEERIAEAGIDRRFYNGELETCLKEVMDYISNSFLMPFISLLTSILIGWVIGPDWIIGEVERNGEHFRRAGLYRFMIRYVVPIVMLILFLVSAGFADWI